MPVVGASDPLVVGSDVGSVVGSYVGADDGSDVVGS